MIQAAVTRSVLVTVSFSNARILVPSSRVAAKTLFTGLSTAIMAPVRRHCTFCVSAGGGDYLQAAD
jgi:exosortase/archaeosortase